MREGRKLAYLISKHALHVWSSDDPKDGDRCQCAAVRWGQPRPHVRMIFLKTANSRGSLAATRTSEEKILSIGFTGTLNGRRWAESWTCAQIAAAVGVSAATAARIVRRAGLARLGRLGAPPTIQRYGHARPGDLLHPDTKKLG